MKALILVISQRGRKIYTPFEYESKEISNLLRTYGIFDSESIHVKIDEINPALYIGKGKAYEISYMIKSKNIGLVVADKNLTYTQARNLEEIFGVRVIDKTFLIIEIFKQRARSCEGKLQVELAELRYNLSRLRGFGYSLDQQHGMIGTRGSGERKIEYERRRIKDRISKILSEIKHIRNHRGIQRKQRLKIPFPVVTIAGYTNAGKSTLLNTLSGKSDVYSDDLLFATLDPTARRVKLKNGFYAIFVDTVGFINNLPHLLVAAFSATLEEIRYSDLIIHLHDMSSDIRKQNEVVKKTLVDIGAGDIPLINVFNKMDIVDDIERYRKEYEGLNPVFISALKSYGIEELIDVVYKKLSEKWRDYIVEIPISKIDLIRTIRKEFFVCDENYSNSSVRFTLKLTDENRRKLEKILQG